MKSVHLSWWNKFGLATSISETLRQRLILYSEGNNFSSTWVLYNPKNQACFDFSKAYTSAIFASFFVLLEVFSLLKLGKKIKEIRKICEFLLKLLINVTDLY